MISSPSETSQSHKSMSSEICSQISISVDKNISYDSFLSQNITDNNNNDSCHSNISVTESVFLKTQMQMLKEMLVQIKTDDCAEVHAEITNLADSHLSVTDLFHHAE